MLRVAAVWILLLPAATGAGELYRWVDSDGQVHYADRPPSGGAERLPPSRYESPPAAANEAQRSAYRQRLLDALASERAERREAVAEVEQRRAQQRAECARLRKALLELEDQVRRYVVEEDGRRRYLSDAEIDAERLRLEAADRKHCR